MVIRNDRGKIVNRIIEEIREKAPGLIACKSRGLNPEKCRQIEEYFLAGYKPQSLENDALGLHGRYCCDDIPKLRNFGL